MRLIMLLLFLGLTSGSLVWADSNNSDIIAEINGEKIYKSGIDIIIEDLERTGTKIDEKDRNTLIDRLVEQKLIAQFARKGKYDTREDVQKQIEVMTDMVLKDTYLSDLIIKNVTPKVIEDQFNNQMKTFKPKFEFKASHILVVNIETAQHIKDHLDDGADFTILAKKYSSDSNADTGGDLGYFSSEMMVKPFSDAVAGLTKNETSNPVKTDFGWHIIRLTDKRKLPTPTLEQLTPQIKVNLSRTVMADHIAELKKSSKIKFYNRDASYK
ncbi:MAG: peptidyl-prolyl cis-trans isomerase C [Alphaproteobacteria bacterium]|jgi:peptidyl-prolyl cis-trans isomerase C